MARSQRGSILHTCCVCSHQWRSMDQKTERHVVNAAKVNGAGPHCDLCHHLEMAYRYAERRQDTLLFTDVVINWLNKRKT